MVRFNVQKLRSLQEMHHQAFVALQDLSERSRDALASLREVTRTYEDAASHLERIRHMFTHDPDGLEAEQKKIVKLKNAVDLRQAERDRLIKEIEAHQSRCDQRGQLIAACIELLRQYGIVWPEGGFLSEESPDRSGQLMQELGGRRYPDAEAAAPAAAAARRFR